MSKVSVFAKIVYYIFTFAIGILMALFLPYIYMYDGESLNMMEEFLQDGDCDKAMAMVGGYYQEDAVFSGDFDNGSKIVIFESATLYEQSYNDGKTTKHKMHMAYACFVYNVGQEYDVYATDNNLTMLQICTSTGDKDFALLNQDTNNDNVKDTIASLLTNQFFFIELSVEEMRSLDVGDISALRLIDKSGQTYGEIALPAEIFGQDKLFDSQFFHDVSAFIDKHNQAIDYSVTGAQDADFEQKATALSEELNTLGDQVMQNEHYAKSTTSLARSRADKRATVTVIIYFICVYVVADFILGTRYIIKGAKWILVKVFKVNFDKKRTDAETFGSDYYCQAELRLDTTAVKDLGERVTLTYTSGAEQIDFVLTKDADYCDTRRVKAGTYNLITTDLPNHYKLDSLSATIVAQGYKKAITIKILMQED